MIGALLLAAITVAYPRPNVVVPPVTSCYMIGAVPAGITNLTVGGHAVAPYRTGAWATRVGVVPGTNTVTLAYAAANGAPIATALVFRVARPAKTPASTNAATAKAATATNAAPTTVWKKMPGCGDTARPHPTGKRPPEMLVVVDPGHGGPKDLGALSPHGWCEKDVNLLLARDVKVALEKRGYRVLLTRDDDRALSLGERPAIAVVNGAEAFVSIHHNAPAADADAAAIRYKSVYAWNPLGARLSEAIAKRMSARPLKANFAVTRNPEVPSVLVEADFITHPAGEEAAWDAAVRAQIAAQIAAGLADWHAAPAKDR